MHELSIAQAVIDIASAHAEGRRVTAVEVKVGHLRAVVPAALQFAFMLAAEGTPVEGARLELEHVPVACRCRRCGRETEPDRWPLACAACGALDVEVIRGEELLVASLECEDEMAVSG